MPKISVIVPVYKVEKYLDKCVQSILNQTFTDFELILVDDGSPDNCPKLCDDYALKDSRIKVIHKPNGGLSDARNAGLDVAIGEYIYFCDSDDYIDENLLEKTYNCAVSNNADAVRFGYYNTFAERLEPCSPIELNLIINSEVSKFEFITNVLLNCTIGWSAWGWLFRAKIINQNHLRFYDNKAIFAEDIFFSCLFSFYANKIVSIGESLYYYIVNRESSLMAKAKEVIKLNEMNLLSKVLFNSLPPSFEYIRQNFGVIHFQLISNQLCKIPRTQKLLSVKTRGAEIHKVNDLPYFLNQMNLYYSFLKTNRKKPFFDILEEKIIVKFYINNNKVSLHLKWFFFKLLRLPLTVFNKFFKSKSEVTNEN